MSHTLILEMISYFPISLVLTYYQTTSKWIVFNVPERRRRRRNFVFCSAFEYVFNRDCRVSDGRHKPEIIRERKMYEIFRL